MARIRRRRQSQAGYSISELMMAMGMINIVLSVILPNIRALIADAELSKAEQELITLKSAVTSYWRHNGFTYPPDVHGTLLTSTPRVINQIIHDPFYTDLSNNTYGYITGTDFTFGPYFAIYTQGPKGDTIVPVWDSANQRITFSGTGRVVSNAPVFKVSP